MTQNMYTARLRDSNKSILDAVYKFGKDRLTSHRFPTHASANVLFLPTLTCINDYLDNCSISINDFFYTTLLNNLTFLQQSFASI
jgi:hypothetical protein